MSHKFSHRVVSLFMALAIAFAGVTPALAAPPSNDNFDFPTLIEALPFSDSVDNSEATTEPNEPQPYYSSPRTVWYSFTPTANAVLIADLEGSSFGDTILNVYWAQASNFGGLNFLGYTVFGGSVTFSVEAGITYYLQAGSIDSGGGDLHVNLQLIPPPLNDNFSSAKVIPLSLPYGDSENTVAATREGNEPYAQCAQSSGDRTVWYAFTPTESGLISASIPSSSFYPKLAVYTGNSLLSLTEVGCRYGWSVLSFQANAGTTYYIQAGAYYDGEGGEMEFQLEVTPPPVADFSFDPSDPSVFNNINFCDNSFDPGDVGIQSMTWDFGDGATSTDNCAAHQYLADGNYTVQHSVTTFDGRSASTSQVVQVRTHDVSIIKVAAPKSANVGQTKTINVSIKNNRYPETVTIELYRSVAGGGFELIGLSIQFVPVRPGNRTSQFTFNYTFSPQDAQAGKVTFKAIVFIENSNDGFPADNEAISTPPTVVKGRISYP